MRPTIEATLAIFLFSILLCGCQTVAATGGVGYGTGALTVSAYGDFLYPAPSDAYEKNRTGFRYYQNGDYENAVNTFSEVLQQYPDSPDARYYLGLSLVSIGEREKGLQYLATFRDKYHLRQTSDIRWWAQYFIKYPEKTAKSIRDTMRRIRAEARQQEIMERFRGPGLGWGM